MSDAAPNVKSVFGKALEITSPTQRQAYLHEACAGNGALRAEVEGLLQALDQAGSFMRVPAAQGETAGHDPAVNEGPGTVIGPYELMEQIGEGGFGLVFVAEQQEPVRRKVALKIIKPGMDSREVIARFEAERQALALMDHPNIAHIFDGGTTDSGRPYFVMELVKGIPIIEYCDQQQLTARQRLELFLVVCQAVQHAHGKGIIHRDLKPSNILVAPHDGIPVVKVIDFGIAKAIGQQLTSKKIYTRFTQMIGTPLYMSPEQAEINALDVDIRSDVYSLGVLLYELLTGSTPFDRERFATAAYDEIRRIIREEEPPKPSTRLSTLGATLSKVSQQRQTAPAKLSALVKGDLDWIVMKALEKDRTRRYETASGLAKDVDRFLKDEAVEACPPSAWYRFRKMTKRNKAAMTTAALVAATLLLGFVVSAWQAVRATRAEDAALVAKAQALTARDEEVQQRKLAVENQEKATDEGNKAEAARDAELARGAELKVALENAEKAEKSEKQRAGELAVALKKAEQAQLKAEANETKAEGRLYASHIASAQRGWESSNVSLLYHFLDQWRQDFRGWEHDYLYTLANQNLKTLRGHTSSVYSVAFSPDGKRLASSGSDGFGGNGRRPCTVKLWDTDSAQVVLSLPHKWYVNCVAFSPDGKCLASSTRPVGAAPGGAASEMMLWDAASGKEIQTFKGHTPEVNSVAFSPDGKRLAGAGGFRAGKNAVSSGTVTLWDAASGQVLLTLNGHTKVVLSVAFSPDGRRLASASEDNTVKLWELASGQEYLTLQGHTGAVHSVVFSPDGKRLATTSGDNRVLATTSDDNTVKIWDAANGKEIQTLKGHTSSVNGVAFSPDGKRLASGSRDTTVMLWDAANGKEIQTLKGHTSNVYSVAFSPDGKRLASGSYDGTVKLWDAAGVQKAPGASLGEERGLFNGIAFSPDGKRLASASDYKTLKLWDVASGHEVLTLNTNSARCVAFSPDSKRLASSGGGNSVKLWDAASGEEIRTLQGHTRVVHSVAFSPDGKRLASASFDNTVKLWDAASGQDLLTLIGHTDSVVSVAFSPDGKRLASASYDKTVRLWDTASGQQLLILRGHINYVNSVAFSPDGKRLASASGDYGFDRPETGEVKLWDAASGQQLLTLYGHTEMVNSVAFSPDGKRLASRSDDKTVRLWDVASGQEVLTLKLQTKYTGLGAVAFSPDGKRLAATAEYIIIWDASKSISDSSFDLNRLGIALAAKNQLDEAIAAFRKAIDIDPKFADACFNLGIALGRKNQLDQAIAAHRKAIDNDPNYLPAYFHLGNALQDKNQLDEAIAAFRKAIAIGGFPKRLKGGGSKVDSALFALVYYNLGNALRDNKQQDEAIAAYREAIYIDPNDAKVHNDLAWVLGTCADQKLRDPATALASAKKAVELDPMNRNYWGTLAVAHYRSGEWKEAIGALDKPLALLPGGTSSDFFFLAMSHRQLGHVEQARAWYDKGVQWMTQYRPKDEELQRFRAEAAELLGIPIVDRLSKDMPLPKK